MVGLGKTTQLAMAAMPMALWGNTRWRNVSACPPPYAGSLGIERIGQKRDTVYVFNMRYRDSIEDRVHQMSGLPGGRAQLRGVEVGHPGAVPHQPPEAAGRWPRRPGRHHQPLASQPDAFTAASDPDTPAKNHGCCDRAKDGNVAQSLRPPQSLWNHGCCDIGAQVQDVGMVVRLNPFGITGAATAMTRTVL